MTRIVLVFLLAVCVAALPLHQLHEQMKLHRRLGSNLVRASIMGDDDAASGDTAAPPADAPAPADTAPAPADTTTNTDAASGSTDAASGSSDAPASGSDAPASGADTNAAASGADAAPAPAPATASAAPSADASAVPSGLLSDEDANAHNGFRKYLMAFLEKYKAAAEDGGQPCKSEACKLFFELFPSIEATRASNKGYTTCVDFQGRAISYAETQSGQKLKKHPDVNMFAKNTRKQQKIPPESFYSVLPTGKTAADMNDDTCQWVDISAADSARPKPGDPFLLEFSADQSAILKKGMFSHFGIVTKITKVDDKTEDWTVVAGGGGVRSTKNERVTESTMRLHLDTQLTGPVDNQPGRERRLHGWASLDALL